MPATVAHPVRTFREHATNFEAALTVCLADPKPRAVHKLRTESRRLEAQIALLNELHELPPHRTEAAAALRHMKKIRQAAGEVRDLDVQVTLLGERERQKAAHAVAAAASAEGETLTEVREERHEELEQMIATREARRADGAAKLVAIIQDRQAEVSVSMERLFHALKPAKDTMLPAAELLRIAEGRFRRTRAFKRKRPSEDDLHTVRKAAKQTRYLAETSPARLATAAAVHYESLQEAGGKWHDWLDLAAQAKKELGRKHAATREFVALRKHYLAAYQAKLKEFRTASVAVAMKPKNLPRKRQAQA